MCRRYNILHSAAPAISVNTCRWRTIHWIMHVMNVPMIDSSLFIKGVWRNTCALCTIPEIKYQSEGRTCSWYTIYRYMYCYLTLTECDIPVQYSYRMWYTCSVQRLLVSDRVVILPHTMVGGLLIPLPQPPTLSRGPNESSDIDYN